jgi:hypothetical protein
LINASRSLEKAKQLPASVYQQALADVQVAFVAIDQQMGQLHFAAPDSSLYLDRFRQLFQTMGGKITSLEPLPKVQSLSAYSLGQESYDQFIRLSATLLSDTNQILQLLRSKSNLDPVANQLLRDTEFFQSQISSIEQTASVAMLKQDLRQEILRLRALSEGITRTIQRSGQVGRVAQRWALVLEDMRELGELVGVSTGATIDPGQPVMLNLPTYHRLPYQVRRPTAAELSSKAIPVTDQAIAHVDAFVTGFNRFLHLSPRVPALQAQARQLRVRLGQFRQELAGGVSLQQLQTSLAQINDSLQSISVLWMRTVQERQLTNTPNLNGLSESVQNLNQIFEGA